MKYYLVLITFFLSVHGFSQRSYEVIYEVTSDGEPISGNKEVLINQIRSGNPIRVGWELTFKYPDTTIVLEHWADAGFISIHMGEVFVQINSIYEQSTSHVSSKPQVFLGPESQAHDWVALIGTNGIMKQRFKLSEEMRDFFESTGLSEDEIKERVKKMSEMKVRTKWAVMQ